MNKKEAVELLIENNYRAEIENNVVMVFYEDEDPFEEVKKLLRENGYEASFGTKKKKESSKKEEEA